MAGNILMVLSLDGPQKRLLECAAAHLGLSLSDFVHDAVLREAHRIVTSGGGVMLTQAESRCFQDEIDLPFHPNKKMAKALKRVK